MSTLCNCDIHAVKYCFHGQICHIFSNKPQHKVKHTIKDRCYNHLLNLTFLPISPLSFFFHLPFHSTQYTLAYFLHFPIHTIVSLLLLTKIIQILTLTLRMRGSNNFNFSQLSYTLLSGGSYAITYISSLTLI